MVGFISFICIAHFYLAHEAVIRPEHD